MKTSTGSLAHSVALSLILLTAITAAAGCDGIGKTDSRLARSWSSGPGSLTLKADGTYTMSLKGSSAPGATIINESGKWGVKGDQLTLRNEKSSAMTTYHYRLNEKDELELTPDALNPNKISVTYRATSNP